MMKQSTRVVVASMLPLAALSGPHAQAQFRLPNPAPAVKLSVAAEAASKAFAKCKGTPIAVAVLDNGGGTKLLMNSDGSPALFAEFALRKAATALTFGKPSSQVRDAAKADTSLAERLRTDPKLIGFGGGLPIAKQGKSLGALAVAGAPSQDQDELCAKAALDYIQAH